MTHTSKTIVFFGTEEFSVATLNALINSRYPIAFVVTKPDTARGRGRQLTAPRVKTAALAAGIPVLQPTKIADIIPELQKLYNPLGILVSYGKIIPQSVIDCFTPGIINVHPSLLPKYRGPSPIETAILNGDKTTGISIMQLTKAMDAGPVYRQEIIALSGDETSQQLYVDLAKQGADILLQSLPSIVSGEKAPLAQNENQATYCSLLTKKDGLLHPDQMSAAECERAIRAFVLYPKARLLLYNHLCVILKAYVNSTEDTTRPSQRCKDGNFLIIDRLISPSGKTISGQDFIRGYAR